MKNEEYTKEYFNKWKSVKLSSSSRMRMQDDLLKYAQFHTAQEDVRVGDTNRSIKQVPDGAWIIKRLLNNKFTSMTALILIALLLGGGTTYAAQGAVPGDVLYPVKVDVNDNVRTALAFGDDAKASVQTDLVKERLGEAQQLAAEGKLSASASSELNASVSQHYQAALMHSDNTQAQGDISGAANVRASLFGTFRSYATVLDHLNKTVAGNNGQALIASLSVYSDNVTQAQAQASTSIANDPQAQAHITAAIEDTNQQLAKVTAVLAQNKTKLSTDMYTQITAQLDSAQTLQVHAQASLQAQIYTDAYTAVQAADVRIAQAESMIQSALQLQSHTSVSLDGLFNTTTTDTSASTSATQDTTGSNSAATSSSVNINANLGTQITASSSNDDTQGVEINNASLLNVKKASDAVSVNGSTSNQLNDNVSTQGQGTLQLAH